MPCSSVWLFGFNVTVSRARMISDNSYLWAWKLERNETLHVHVQHGKLLQRVQCWSGWSHRWRRSSWMRRMLGQQVRSTRHNTVRHDGQLVTPFYDVTSWPCDELTGSLPLRYPASEPAHELVCNLLVSWQRPCPVSERLAKQLSKKKIPLHWN